MTLTDQHCEAIASIYNRLKGKLQFIAPLTTAPVCEDLYEELYSFLRMNVENFDGARFYKATH